MVASNAEAAVGPDRHANDDFDSDGVSNLQKLLLGSNPTGRASNPRITAFNAPN